MNAPRSLIFQSGLLVLGLLVNSVVGAQQLAAFHDQLAVPPYVKDVRQIVHTGIARHHWRVLEEKPGQITSELRHEREHVLVVAQTFYGDDFIRVQFVSADTLNCSPGSICLIHDSDVKKWLTFLRREYALQLLNAAIVDAGGTVVGIEERKARFRSPEQSLAAPGPTEVSNVAKDLYGGAITGEQYFDLAAERLVQIVDANPGEEQQENYESAIEWLGMALAKGGNGRYRGVLGAVAPRLKVSGLRRKYENLLADIPPSDTAQYQAGSAALPVFVDNYAEGLSSTNPLFVQNVAIIMREAGEKRQELFELSAKRIEKDRHDSNRYAASASAHLCRFLITSNDPRYADFYRNLVEFSANGSLRGAAKAGLVNLGQWKKK